MTVRSLSNNPKPITLMSRSKLPRRDFLTNTAAGGLAACALPALAADTAAKAPADPAATGSQRLSLIEGKKYYLPGEVCDPIGRDWFWVAGDKPRADDALLQQFETCRAGGASFLLDVPPDKHGLIPDETVAALARLRNNLKI